MAVIESVANSNWRRGWLRWSDPQSLNGRQLQRHMPLAPRATGAINCNDDAFFGSLAIRMGYSRLRKDQPILLPLSEGHQQQREIPHLKNLPNSFVSYH
jgi:hypothetical protein